MKKSIAIITARGGSKRIPKKNIKVFCGKPIIQYSIEAAIDSGVFDEVMVSTDDKDIAEISRSLGAKVPFMRSSLTSNDFATTTDVLVEVLNEYIKQEKVFDYACCLYPTAPFITPERLKSSMKKLVDLDADSVIPVVKYSFPIQRSLVVDGGKVRFKYKEYENTRSQDLISHYHDSGQFYCFNVDKFLENKKLVSENTLPIILSDLEVQDIDTLDDWLIAEMKYKLLKGGDL